MVSVLIDAFIDTLKLIPYLFLTFLILEFLEHKISQKMQSKLFKYKKIGPLVGGVMGGFPQCGFSAMAVNLYTARVITIGTLIAVFLATSDEMLPIMISENVPIGLMIGTILLKVIVGVAVGFLVDFILRKKVVKNERRIEKICKSEHCHCEEKGIVWSSAKHTLKTLVFVLCANLLIGFAIYFVGIDSLANMLNNGNVLVYFMASLVGLIPNCAASIMLTEIYLGGIISFGTLIAGLLTSAGIGILLLLKSNKNWKENLKILAIVYFVGVVTGVAVDLLIVF